MKAVVAMNPPCRMHPGELRRVPRNLRSPVVGYYVCCPRCGFVTVAFNGRDDLVITEDESRSDITFSKPIRCTYCAVLIHLKHTEIELEEDTHVRNVRYRVG